MTRRSLFLVRWILIWEPVVCFEKSEIKSFILWKIFWKKSLFISISSPPARKCHRKIQTIAINPFSYPRKYYRQLTSRFETEAITTGTWHFLSWSLLHDHFISDLLSRRVTGVNWSENDIQIKWSEVKYLIFVATSAPSYSVSICQLQLCGPSLEYQDLKIVTADVSRCYKI